MTIMRILRVSQGEKIKNTPHKTLMEDCFVKVNLHEMIFR